MVFVRSAFVLGLGDDKDIEGKNLLIITIVLFLDNRKNAFDLLFSYKLYMSLLAVVGICVCITCLYTYSYLSSLGHCVQCKYLTPCLMSACLFFSEVVFVFVYLLPRSISRVHYKMRYVICFLFDYVGKNLCFFYTFIIFSIKILPTWYYILGRVVECSALSLMAG